MRRRCIPHVPSEAIRGHLGRKSEAASNMLTDDECEDVNERESEEIDGLEAETISALRPHAGRLAIGL